MAKPYIPYDGPIVTRQDAIERGLGWYFTGTLCKHGHLAQRCPKRRVCVACQHPRLPGYNLKWAARKQKWATENPEACCAAARRCRAKNPIPSRKKASRYRIKHPDRVAARQSRYRARQVNATGEHTGQQISDLNDRQKFKCVNCRSSTKTKYHVDHIIPLSLGGSNDIGNLQILCPTCNMRKNAKHPIDWARENRRLL